jgi:hypothetical protein
MDTMTRMMKTVVVTITDLETQHEANVLIMSDQMAQIVVLQTMMIFIEQDLITKGDKSAFNNV